MTNSSRKDCYGALFPTTLRARRDQPNRGKVFSFELLTAGGTFRADRRVSADLKAWDECVGCEEFDGCWRLSPGKLALETTIGEK